MSGAANGLIGAAVRRREDPALLVGGGRYVEDINLPGLLHLALVRSPYPKARILSVDVAAARAAAGVAGVITGADVAHLKSFPVNQSFPGMVKPAHPMIAVEAVYAEGTPVAAVAASSRALAEDAAALVQVTYEPLDGVADIEAAVAPDAPRARDDTSGNICYTVRRGGGEVTAAFAEAQHVVKAKIVAPRLASVAMEPRGLVAAPDPLGEGVTVWLSTQGPFRARADLAYVLDFPENRIRVIAPDVGGGFGPKGALYREDVLATFLALKLGRPVKWVATRREDMLTTMQGRDLVIEAELALLADGTMTGLRVRALANLGAYLHVSTAGPPTRLLAMSPGCYRIPNVQVEVTGVFTNTPPTGPYRGAGRPESVLLIERLVDQAAHELGVDPVELRRRNFITPDQFPHRTVTGVVYDSGNYAGALDHALSLADYPSLLRQRDAARGRAEISGIGLCTFVEPSGGQGFESGAVRIERSGQVTVTTGSSAHGQGHHTVFAQVVAQQLGVPMDQVVVQHGDTRSGPQGVGTFGSRSGALGSGALVQASERVVEKARRMAAHLLEASPDDLERRGGLFSVRGAPSRSVSWVDLADAAYRSFKLPADEEPGLEATAYFQAEGEMYAFGAHVALVAIDRDTGRVRIERLVAVDDCGNILNPIIVEGQVQGGLAQGLGQALLEQVVFDPGGQLVSGSLLDYAVPRAADMPPLVLGHTVTPSPNNPLGVKGVGESGTIGAPPAVLNAVLDALWPLGVRQMDMPLTPARVWEALQAVR